MAKVYITEHPKMTLHFGNPLPVAKMPPLATQNVAIGSETKSSAFSADTYIVGIHTDAICSVAFGSSPTATTNDRRLAANTTEYFEVTPGHKVSVISNT